MTTGQPALTVLSFGGGQDSTAILYLLAEDQEARAKYAPGRLLVIMSDTGDEHQDTLEHVYRIKAYCQVRGIEFAWIRPGDGYHGKWNEGMRAYHRAHGSIGSKAFPKTCTDNLKIQPIYRYLEAWVAREYGYVAGRKAALKAFARDHGRIRVLLGIAKGEEKRVSPPETWTPWRRLATEAGYPLLDLGLDRAACQAYIASRGHAVPPPSNCITCHFKSPIEILWTARKLPADFADWVALEAAKLKKWAEKGEKNLGVNGRKTLPQVLAEAEARYGHLTDAELDEYRMSHGHCVKNAY